MKKFYLFTLFAMCCLLNICSGQHYKYVYYLNAQLGSVKEPDAIVIGKAEPEDSLVRLDCFSRQNGILFMSAHFVDSSLTIMQGKFTSFHKNGKVENEGEYLNNEKNGLWQKWDTSGQKVDSIIYRDGKAYTTATFNHFKNGILSYYSVKDSLADTFQSFSYDDKGAAQSEVFFKGQSGILKTYNPGGATVDSLYTREEQEASFPGGVNGWIRYLMKNLNPNVPVSRGARPGTYQVFVKFIIAKDGSISDVKAETNYGYGMEKEVILLIKNGPKWVPAIQYGRKVNAYRRQPVTFVIDDK